MTSRDPVGRWATCAQSPRGVVGIAVGVGNTQSFFLPENIVSLFCEKAEEVGPADQETREIVPLIRRAAEGLVQFKKELKAAHAANN